MFFFFCFSWFACLPYAFVYTCTMLWIQLYIQVMQKEKGVGRGISSSTICINIIHVNWKNKYVAIRAVAYGLFELLSM